MYLPLLIMLILDAESAVTVPRAVWSINLLQQFAGNVGDLILPYWSLGTMSLAPLPSLDWSWPVTRRTLGSIWMMLLSRGALSSWGRGTVQLWWSWLPRRPRWDLILKLPLVLLPGEHRPLQLIMRPSQWTGDCSSAPQSSRNGCPESSVVPTVSWTSLCPSSGLRFLSKGRILLHPRLPGGDSDFVTILMY